MSEDLLDRIASLAAETGAVVHVVGGYIRDHLLGREPVDLDLLVEGNAGAFLAALSRRAGFEPVVFSRREPVTYRVAMGDWLIDVSSCRPGHLAEALGRRDFTINTLAAPLRERGPDAGGPRPSRLDPPVDLFGGLRDLRERRIRHVTAAALDEDPVRILRAVRLASVLDGFTLDAGLIGEMAARASLIATSPPERLMAELEVILATPRAGAALRLMADTGLLFQLFPEIRPLAGLGQNQWHRYDVLEHTLRTVEEADLLQGGLPEIGIDDRLGLEEAEILKWAALLHDSGKAATARVGEDGQRHFYGHEAVSAEIAAATLGRLRSTRRRTDRVRALVASHLRLTLLAEVAPASDRGVRRLVHRAGKDTPLLCLLSVADRRAGGGPDFDRRLAALIALAARAMTLYGSEGDALIAPAPLLTGDDVMRILDIPPGPRVGAVLRWITRLQVEEKLTRRDDAVKLLSSLPASKLVTIEDEA